MRRTERGSRSHGEAGRAWDVFLPLALLVLLLGLWEGLVRGMNVPPYLLPPPSRIFAGFFTRFGFLWPHILATLGEILLGLAMGAAGGFALGSAMFYWPTFDRAVRPFVIASQMVPVFAIAPLLIVWMGYGLWPKAIVAALISFFPVAVNSLDGLRAANPETVDLLYSFGATEWQTFRKLRMPAGLPQILSGLKIGATLAVVGATIGEWIGGQRGLGYLMLQANAQLRMETVFASILALTIIGLLVFGGFRIIERRLLRWQHPDDLA